MEELSKYMHDYYEKFNDIFPMFYFSSYAPKDTIDIIKECILNKKNVFELGYVKVDDDELY